MTLADAIAAAGMTPPSRMLEGKWLRFPGAGKGKSNRAGWCRILSPTMAVYGDFSSNFSAVWHDDTHVDDATSRRLLEEARRRGRVYAEEQRWRRARAAERAAQIVRESVYASHAYLERKGFPKLGGLVYQGEPIVPEGKQIFGAQLVVPMRDVSEYQRIISAQLIDERGEKVFLPGARAQGAIYRIGADPRNARRVALCEGYATGLSIHAALQRLPGPHMVIVCFSAGNLERVADGFPRAVVCADNDPPNPRTGEKAGEEAAKRTGLPWAMPPEVGTDFNDLHLRHGLHAVTEILRSLN